MKVIFLGTSEFAVHCLKALLASKHEVLAVVCQPDKPSGRGNKLCAPPVKKFALENNLKIYQFDKIKVDGVEVLKNLGADVLAVASYGQILSQEILDIALPINVHGSLLPKYRGASPIQSAIINGEKETGITIIKMAFAVDAGDILLQEKIKIEADDNSVTMFEKLGLLGGKMLVEALDIIQAGKAKFVPQNESEATFTKILTKESAKIDFSKTSDEIVNKVRGYLSGPVAFFEHAGEHYKVFSARKVEGNFAASEGVILASSSRDGLVFKTADGGVEILELQAPGGKRMLAKAFLNGKKLA